MSKHYHEGLTDEELDEIPDEIEDISFDELRVFKRFGVWPPLRMGFVKAYKDRPGELPIVTAGKRKADCTRAELEREVEFYRALADASAEALAKLQKAVEGGQQ